MCMYYQLSPIECRRRIWYFRQLKVIMSASLDVKLRCTHVADVSAQWSSKDCPDAYNGAFGMVMRFLRLFVFGVTCTYM